MTNHIDGHDTDAKLALQHRQQLSALVDGDLAPDQAQARFLLRRLEHDGELAGRWQRWQLIGDVLRGQPVAALPAGADGFAARVAASVARDGVRPAAGWRLRWHHGLGMAAAASVAAVALFVARPLSVDSELTDAVAAVETPSATLVAEAAPMPAEPVREVSVPQFAAATPTTGETASSLRSAPVQPAPVRQSPVVLAAGASGASVREPAPAEPLDAGTRGPEATSSTLVADTGERPFAPIEPQARPWPRAVLPDLAGQPGGPFTVGFGDMVEAPSFYPFEPQLPERAVDPERPR